MATEALRGSFRLRVRARPSQCPALPFFCLLFFNSGLYIHYKEAKKEGGESAGCTTTANFRFWVVASMATCSFTEIPCNSLSLKITNSLLEQVYEGWVLAHHTILRRDRHCSEGNIVRARTSHIDARAASVGR